jgi:iron complex outermembrane receptor protein
MRRILLATLFFLPATVFAQHAIYGQIIDARDGTPLIGATAVITELRRGAVADMDGMYLIDNLPSGSFLVEYKYAGYESRVERVRVDGRTEHNVALTPAVTELNEVVVTGISHSTELKRSPIPVTTIRPESLREKAGSNIVDKIAGHPGVGQITTGAGISKPVIRGLGFNRVIVLYDGIRQEGQQWGDEHGLEIDEFAVDRVEIIKGAGSLMYGSDGLGGIISLLAPHPASEGKIEGQWISNYQSNNGLFANSLSVGGNRNGVYWMANATRKDARSYRNRYDGYVFNSGFNELNLGATLGMSGNWGFTQLHATTFNQNLGLPEGERDAEGNFLRQVAVGGQVEERTVTRDELRDYSLYIPNQSVRHLRIASNTNYYRGESRIQFDLGYQRNIRKEYGNVLVENEEELQFDLHTTTWSLIYHLPPVNDLRFSVGTSGSFQKNISGGEEFLIPDHRIFDWGVFAFTKWHYKTLDVAGGFRFDRRSFRVDPLYLDDEGAPSDDPSEYQKFAGGSPAFSNYSASLGVTEALSSALTLKMNISRGFRAPSVTELYANGRHEGSLQYEYGNPGLDAEKSFQLDFGLNLQTDHITIEAALFRNVINDYIYLRKLVGSDGRDSIPDPDEPVPAYAYTQGDARLAGAELTVDIHPHPFDWLHFENTLSTIHALNLSERASDSTRYLPFIPAPSYRGQLRANLNVFGRRIFNSFVMLEFRHTWEQNRVLLENGTETPTPSYSIWNAAAGTSIRKRNSQDAFMSVYLSLNNIFDTAYQDHLSRLKYAPENPVTSRRGIFNMGRNFSVKVIVPLGGQGKK